MERKRKLPARAARGESISKRMTLTPPKPTPVQSPTPALLPPAPERTALPTTIAAGKPLPTVNQPQPDDLPSKDYQSIPESGVLTESLLRSRQKWTSEGIFEKYWTKHRKGKNAPGEPHGNPPKDSMTKLGTCTITVEPHIFEATLYGVKDMTPRTTSTTQTPLTRPVLQYGPPGGVVPLSPTQRNTTKKNQSTPNQNHNHSVSQEKIESNSFADDRLPSTQPVNCNKHTSSNSSISAMPTELPVSPSSRPCTTNEPLHKPQVPIHREVGTAVKSTDPVIHKLAQQAATDSNLKNLMRLVANGEASPEQLKRFQNHISELTVIEKSRQEMQHPSNTSSVSSATMTLNSTNKVTIQPSLSTLKASSTTPCNLKYSPNQNQTPSHSLKSQGLIPQGKSDINGVVLEFADGNGDRYSFPRYSILEFIPCSNQVLISFLIIRKGSDTESQSYDPNLDYYQPMTIRLYAHQNRQLEALQKAVESPDEVKRWMNKVMDECQRAEYVLLAMRLPREIDHSSPVEMGDNPRKSDQMNMQINWATTNASLEPKGKSAKKKATEEETYRGYTNSVAAIS